MPSSISSSDAHERRWWPTWLGCVIVAAGIVIGAEWYWRHAGYVPNVRDSPQLWSIQRDRVDRTRKIPLALLGASRIEFGIDMKLLRQLLPNYEPIMLAQNGRYPLAVLRDLADDENFRGTVLCDIEPTGLYKKYTDVQQPLVDYYRRQWSPSWHVHRLLLNAWQKHADVANSDFSVAAALVRLIAGDPPLRPDYFRFRTDRSGDIDYTRTDVEAAKNHFRELINRRGNLHADVEPDQWLADLEPVIEWTRRIEARGGHVIFYQSPTSGQVRVAEHVIHPPELYWNRFADRVPAALDGLANPALSAFVEPDDSHLDFRDKPAYTRALVDELVQRGWLQK
ncbi:MAG: hypothetical protein ABJB01_03000 [Rudaea sp.]